MNFRKLTIEVINTTWKIIHIICGKNSLSNPKMKKRDDTATSNEMELLAEWDEYFSSLHNNENGPTPAYLPTLAEHDLHLQIYVDPPTLQETKYATEKNNNKQTNKKLYTFTILGLY